MNVIMKGHKYTSELSKTKQSKNKTSIRFGCHCLLYAKGC